MALRDTLIHLPGVRGWRIRRALLPQELAELAAVSMTTLERIASGGLATRETMNHLADALRVDAADLMEGHRPSAN